MFYVAEIVEKKKQTKKKTINDHEVRLHLLILATLRLLFRFLIRTSSQNPKLETKKKKTTNKHARMLFQNHHIPV